MLDRNNKKLEPKEKPKEEYFYNDGLINLNKTNFITDDINWDVKLSSPLEEISNFEDLIEKRKSIKIDISNSKKDNNSNSSSIFELLYNNHPDSELKNNGILEMEINQLKNMISDLDNNEFKNTLVKELVILKKKKTQP